MTAGKAWLEGVEFKWPGDESLFVVPDTLPQNMRATLLINHFKRTHISTQGKSIAYLIIPQEGPQNIFAEMQNRYCTEAYDPSSIEHCSSFEMVMKKFRI